MTSPIATSTIVQQAFRYMEVTPPASLSEPGEKGASATSQYPMALEICLAHHDWGFARRMARLPILSPLPEGEIEDPELPYLHQLPGNCVRLRAVVSKVKWRQEGELIRSQSATGLTVRYTRLITDETKLPALFQTAVSYQLAVRLAPKHVGSRTKRADLKTDAIDALEQATVNDRVTASAERWDGHEDQNDWVHEAQR